VSDVLLVVHPERPVAQQLARAMYQWLGERGHGVRLPAADAVACAIDAVADDEFIAVADLVVTIGGDGTILRAVELLDGRSVRILGVNVGLLGYLTELEPDHALEGLERALGGDCRIEERMMIEVDVVSATGSVSKPWQALNEASLEKREAGHTVRLLVRIDGEVFTSYQADGLIVATPTGSTAYSLSARGPVVSPRHRALLMTPVSPHQMFDRSLVLDPEEDVDVEVLEHRAVELAVDGRRVVSLEPGDRVRCRVAGNPALFVRLGPVRFHQILKAKFGLTDR
jgi:NAD+ kinase